MTTLMDIKDTINDVDAAMMGYSSVSNREYHFTNDKDIDIEIHGIWEEPGWEYFVPDIKIDLNGTRLYGTGSRNVSSYHNESYQEGIYEDPDDALNALEKYIDLDGLARRDYAPTLKDRDMKEALDAFMAQPDVQESLQLREQSREAQRAARAQEQQAEENERQHWKRVNEYGGFIHVEVDPAQVHPVKSQTALKWDKNYERDDFNIREERTLAQGSATTTSMKPVWVTVGKDMRVFVPSGLMDRDGDTYIMTMEPNNTKKVFTGPSLEGKDVKTEEIAAMAEAYRDEYASHRPSSNFVTVPSESVQMMRRKSDGAEFGVVRLPINGLDDSGNRMGFIVDKSQMRADPIQDSSVLINLNRRGSYKLQYSDATRDDERISAEELSVKVRGALDAIVEEARAKGAQMESSGQPEARERVDATSVEDDKGAELEEQFD